MLFQAVNADFAVWTSYFLFRQGIATVAEGLKPRSERDTIRAMQKIVHTCQKCGACCRWAGDVCLTENEVGIIAAYLGMEEVEFIEKYCRLRANRQGLSLCEHEDGSCIMLQDDNLCRIQAVKPWQCATFPQEWRFPDWEKVCPGSGRKEGA